MADKPAANKAVPQKMHESKKLFIVDLVFEDF